MNEEQLMQALRNAHAAGDTAAARRFAQMIQQIRSSGGGTVASSPVPASAASAPRPVSAGPLPAPVPAAPAASPVSPGMAAALAGAHGGPATDAQLEPATRAQLDVERMTPLQRRTAAQNQGAGSALFGVGTPLTTAGRMVQTALPGGLPAESYGEAREYAQARREALQDESPGAYAAGYGVGIIAGGGAVKAAASALPAAARSVFALQRGQTVRNIARLGGAGAAASGTTELLEDGPGGVPGAAAAGAVAAPLMVGGVRAGGSLVNRAVGFIRPDHSGLRVLARRIGASADELADEYNRFVQRMGRPPRLNEIAPQQLSEELALIGRERSSAGAVLREAAEEARLERPTQLERVVRNRGQISSTPAIAQRMGETTEEAAQVASRGFRTSAEQVRGARDVEFDRVMETIGDHNLPIAADMMDTLSSPDVVNQLPPALRRRVAAALSAGEDQGVATLTVREWDAIRQALGKGAGPGAGQIYRGLRDEIRQYVGRAVPEYDQALTRFGELTDVSRGITLGRGGLVQDASVFGAKLRTVGGGTETTARRPGVRAMMGAGARIGARSRLADLLTGDAKRARRTMERLANDPNFRANVQEVLEPAEADELVRLGDRYGLQIRFGEGFKTGQRVTASKTTEEFREAVSQAGQPERAGIRVGARTALSEAAGESPTTAVTTAVRLAEDPGLATRIEFALGGSEAGRLREVGQLTSRATRNMELAVPAGTQTSARWAEYAQEVQRVIGAGVIAAGRGSGAFIANVGNWIVQRTSLSKRAAESLARRAVDPRTAAETIDQLRRIGLTPEQIVDMYRTAAVAAGVIVGGE